MTRARFPFHTARAGSPCRYAEHGGSFHEPSTSSDQPGSLGGTGRHDCYGHFHLRSSGRDDAGKRSGDRRRRYGDAGRVVRDGNLVNVFGGKMTTFMALARKVAMRVDNYFGRTRRAVMPLLRGIELMKPCSGFGQCMTSDSIISATTPTGRRSRR